MERGGDGRRVVACPDLDGVVTDGESEDEAVINAYEAARAILESLGKDEEFILALDGI